MQALPPKLKSLLDLSRQKHPDLDVPERDFVDALRRSGDNSQPRYVADQYLALAIARGDKKALEQFEHMLTRIDGALRRIKPDDAFVSEVRQEVRIKLVLQRRDGKPGIASYRGNAPLEKWVKAVCLNTALRLNHGGTYETRASIPASLVSKMDSAEVQLLRARNQNNFDAVFTTAMRRLTYRERAVLKLRYVDDLSLTQIAEFLHVDRSTAVRALSAMKEKLTDEIRTELKATLGLSPDEIDSLVRAMGSGFRVSIGRLLRGLSK